MSVDDKDLDKFLDRCDRCGAEAVIEYEVKKGTTLLFCNHHNNRYPTLEQYPITRKNTERLNKYTLAM